MREKYYLCGPPPFATASPPPFFIPVSQSPEYSEGEVWQSHSPKIQMTKSERQTNSKAQSPRAKTTSQGREHKGTNAHLQLPDLSGDTTAHKPRINLATRFSDYRRGGACPRPRETQVSKPMHINPNVKIQMTTEIQMLQCQKNIFSSISPLK
jgi:hypothetical protein